MCIRDRASLVADPAERRALGARAGAAAAGHFSWDEIQRHAARDTSLQPGDVLGSGTLNRGCLLELGPLAGERWLEPGDVVVIAADGLGELAAEVIQPR